MKHARIPAPPAFATKLLLFFVVSTLFLLIDRITKVLVDVVEPNTVLVSDIVGLFDFRLVHNTGAAWGIFADSTFALGIFSLIVCLIILIFLFTFYRANGSLFEIIALALVFAGGLGNAIDRMLYTYVVDFIETTFIEFPVFNIADIGVTCGIALFLIAFFIAEHSTRYRTQSDK